MVGDTEHAKTHGLNLGALNMQAIGEVLENYIWGDTRKNPPKYLGEWVRRLYTDCKIWVCDIELDSKIYDEGIRGPTSDRIYNHSIIGDTKLPYFKTTKEENGFLALLGGYPW
jgi:hypothetical protein